MEKLTVKNFLVIKHAEFDVGRMNFIIGPQASGKSVLAKLLYFFREFLQTEFLFSVQSFESQQMLAKRGQASFERIFPGRVWQSQLFDAAYEVNGQAVYIRNSPVGFSLQYSDALEQFRNELMDDYKVRREGQQLDYKSSPSVLIESMIRIKSLSSQNAFLGDCFRASLYVPAGRAFLSILQKNAFAFFENQQVVVEHLLHRFAGKYDLLKRIYEFKPQLDSDEEKDAAYAKGLLLIERVLSGKFERSDDEDWILSNAGKVNLANASSGQQEALPMLLMNLYWPDTEPQAKVPRFFIEEPEAHLFPTAQGRVVEFFAYTYNRLNHDFVITTHSPYILTAVNNLTLAKDVQDANPGQEIDIMPDPDLHIAYEDVRAYTIEDGVLVSIMDDENRLIGASVIDEVSDEFSAVFDHLLEVQLGG